MSRMKDLFLRGVSAVASTLQLPKASRQRAAYTVTNKAGKPGTNWRRIVRHEVLGPFFRQVGIKWVSGEAQPIMQKYSHHRFLHATKGWRRYIRGLPSHNAMRRPANIPIGAR